MFIINFIQGWDDLRETLKNSSVPSGDIVVYYGEPREGLLDEATTYANIIRECVCGNYETKHCQKYTCGFDSDWNWDDWTDRFISIIDKAHKRINVKVYDEVLP